MNCQELPQLTDFSRTPSASPECNHRSTRKPRRQSEPTFLELMSRSPHSVSSTSFYSSSCVSISQSFGRLPQNSSWSTTDQSKLGTLFEQKSVDITNKDVDSLANRNSVALTRRISENKSNMVRGRLTDVISNSQTVNKSLLKRINSESKLCVDSVHKTARNKLSTINNKRISIDKTDSLTKSKIRNGYSNDMRMNGNAKVNMINSDRNMSMNSERIDPIDFRFGEMNDDEDDAYSVGRLNDRVLQWLDEVDREAEAPPEPTCDYEDAPPQTDSAIHIVYEET